MSTSKGLFDALTDDYVRDDAGAQYRVFIEERVKRGEPRYRYVIERKWVSWRRHREGWWTKDAAKAVRKGNAALARYDDSRHTRHYA